MRAEYWYLLSLGGWGMFTACGCMLGVRYAALKCLYVSWHLLSLCSGVHALRSIELGRRDNAELMDDFVREIAWTSEDICTGCVLACSLHCPHRLSLGYIARRAHV